jgi:hypothetical protein
MLIQRRRYFGHVVGHQPVESWTRPRVDGKIQGEHKRSFLVRLWSGAESTIARELAHGSHGCTRLDRILARPSAPNRWRLCGMTWRLELAALPLHWLTPTFGQPRRPAPLLERLRSRIVLYNPRPTNPERLLNFEPATWRRLHSGSPLCGQSPSLCTHCPLLLGPPVLCSRQT